MNQEVTNLVGQYTAWLKDRTHIREIDDCVEITTPFLDRHNDYLQVYAHPTERGMRLTDDGHTLDDLRMSGCNVNTPKRKELLRVTLRGFGVKKNGRSLYVDTSFEDFPYKKHSLVQAMLAVNDLFFTVSPVAFSAFRDEVSEWLDVIEVRYTPTVKLTGQSGFDHAFDFVIPRSSDHPERVLRAFNTPDRSAAEAMAFSWIDTREARRRPSRAYAILNDSDRSVSRGVEEAITQYDAHPVRWSNREKVQKELAA